MSWAQRLKRVFGIEIETCARCHGRLQVIASIEEPGVIARILAHRDRTSGTSEPDLVPLVGGYRRSRARCVRRCSRASASHPIEIRTCAGYGILSCRRTHCRLPSPSPTVVQRRRAA
jgi:hypothetical protein